MDLLLIEILLFGVPIVLWVIIRTIIRETKKKTYGKLLFSVRDYTYFKDIFLGACYFLIGFIFIFIAVAYGIDASNPYSFFMFFSIYSLTYFTSATYKIEIREFGMLSRDSNWKWDDIDDCYSKEVKDSIVITFKLKNSKNGLKKITIDKKYKAEVETQLENML